MEWFDSDSDPREANYIIWCTEGKSKVYKDENQNEWKVFSVSKSTSFSDINFEEFTQVSEITEFRSANKAQLQLLQGKSNINIRRFHWLDKYGTYDLQTMHTHIFLFNTMCVLLILYNMYKVQWM